MRKKGLRSWPEGHLYLVLLGGKFFSKLLGSAKFGNQHFLVLLRHTVDVAKNGPVSVERNYCQ
jgi:hypothetical protein